MWSKLPILIIIASSAFALTTEQLVDSVRTHLGGVNALKSITALEETGAIKLDKLSGSYSQEWLSSGLFAEDIDFGPVKMKMGIDKDGAWTMDFNGGVAKVGGSQADGLYISRFITGWYCFRPDSGTKWEYLGDTEEGEHRLQAIFPVGSGLTCEIVIDPKTYLPNKLIVNHGAESAITLYGDYRKFNGVMAPFHYEESGGGNISTTDISAMKLLTSADETIFKRPESQENFVMTGNDAVWKVTFFYKYFLIEGKLNDKGPYVFFVDTGASNTVIDSAIAEDIGVKITSGMTGQAVGGNVDVGFGLVDRMELPGITFSKQLVAIIPLQENIGKYMPQIKLGGIIGDDVLGRFAVEMDYVNSTLTLHKANTFKPLAGMQFIPMTISDGMLIIQGKVEDKDLSMVLDTGSSSNMQFAASCVQREKLLDNRKTAISWWGGAAGLEEGRVGRIKSLEIAGFKLENLVAEFSLAESGALGAVSYDANLGAGVLSRFDVVFDYPEQKLGLLPNARFAEQEEPDRMGILALPQKGSIKVVKIDPEGSAAKAGIKVGDEILKVDQTVITEQSFIELRDLFRKPAGTVFNVVINREGKEMTVPVTLLDRF